MRETCQTCGKPVEMMSQKGTGYCRAKCEPRDTQGVE